ncbi:hypothetical protein DICPUDRAFT_15780, partial [Dictyostelium purpureum]
NSNKLKCKVKTLLSLYLDIPRETQMCNRVSNKINNLNFTCHISPNDFVLLVTHCGGSPTNSHQSIDNRSHFIVLYLNNNIIKLCDFNVDIKMIERSFSSTSSSSSPIKSSGTSPILPTLQINFLKEYMDILELNNEQQISIGLVAKYNLLPIDSIYLSVSNETLKELKLELSEIKNLFSLEWAYKGLEEDTPIDYNGGQVNLIQRSGKLIKYSYRVNKPINNNNNDIINQFGIINKQTKLIFNEINNSNNNNINSSVLLNNLESFDNSKNKILKLLNIYFGNNKESLKYDSLGISKARSLLLYGPQSSGKSTIINGLAKYLDIGVIHVCLADLVKYQPNTKGLLLKYYQAKFLKKSILLIDNIDEIFPHLESNTSNSNKNNINSLMSLLLKLLLNNDINEQDDSNNNYNNSSSDINNNNKLFIIGITNKIKLLNNNIRINFEEEVKIDPPGEEKRLEIFNWFLKDFGKNKIEKRSAIVGKINDNCNGLMGGDISILCRNAKINSLNRYKQINNSVAIDIGDIEFQESDFISEFGQYRKDKSMTSKISPSIPKVSWNDIGGLEDAKQILKEMVLWDYQYADSIKRLGVKTHKGILMYGPPGTGKTMLARAVAHEAKANFIPINISELIQGEIGESEKAISEIFRIASNCAPSIIFIDEIQAIFGLKESSGSNSKKLISQLLIELDQTIGRDSIEKRIMILAATNMPQAIDPSFLRVGRFDKTVYIGPPEPKERKQILEHVIKSSSIKISNDVDLDVIAEKAKNYTGSDINALLKKSGLYSIQRDINTTSISMDDILKVLSEMEPSVSLFQLELLKNWENNKK